MKSIPWLPLLVLCLAACAGNDGNLVEPTTDFSLNFCNFPQAWTVSRGQGVDVDVVAGPAVDGLLERIRAAAPDARVRRIEPAAFLAGDSGAVRPQVVLLAERPDPAERPLILTRIRQLVDRNALMVLPVIFGPMQVGAELSGWREFIREARQCGALVAGVHGRFYQLGSLAFWENLPVDTHVLHTRVDGDQARGADYRIPEPMETPACLAAAAAALLFAAQPELSPRDARARFHAGGRRVTWLLSDIQWGDGGQRLEAILNDEMLERRKSELDRYGHRILKLHAGTCLDAALLLGLDFLGDGEWARRVLRVEEAHRLGGTGAGVVVAILDHMFDPKDWSLEGRTVKPGSVLQGAPVFDPDTGLGHGTWMARDLVKTAPDVRVMPVRFCGRGRYGDPDLYIRGIDYAVENGADVISISHQPIPQDRQQDFDDAVARAVLRGVTVVYIHYRGRRRDVVVSRPIEFAGFYEESDGAVYVVGTNFIGEGSFPATWGFSQTAPMVAGVAAMLKQADPGLTPDEIAKVLRESTRPLPEGGRVLDAVLVLNR